VEPPEPELTPEVGDTRDVKATKVAAPRLPDVPRVAPSDSITMAPTVVPDGAQIDPRAVTIPAMRTETPGRGGEVYVPGALERAPMVRFQAQPQYPFEMRRGGIAGEVLVEFIVACERCGARGAGGAVLATRVRGGGGAGGEQVDVSPRPKRRA